MPTTSLFSKPILPTITPTHSMVAKFFISALLLNGVVAFPSIAEHIAKNKRQVVPAVVPFPEHPGTPDHAFFTQFDASSQLVDVSG